MPWYKKILKSRNVRFKILNLLSFIPDRQMLKLQYFLYFNKPLNLKYPKKFTEKIQLYKMTYSNKILPKLVDKYEVRSYIMNKGLSNILPDLYQVSSNINTVEWNELPNKFIIKSTDGAGGLNVMPVYNKDTINLDEIKNSFKNEINKYKKNPGREWPYDSIKHRIIIEELLEDPEIEKGINDYKFFCFNGKVKYIVVDYDRFTNHTRNIYDVNWKNLNIETDKKTNLNKNEPPAKLENMIEIAEKLSEDFPFVRIDLYNIEGKIYFGEFTFFPWSGYVKFYPEEFDLILGEHFKI